MVSEMTQVGYRFRPFQNSDPPALAAIWNSQPRQRGLMHPMTTALLEPSLMCKPYFDREGLILATKGSQAVGFVHAGFGHTDEGRWVTTEMGATLMLMVRPEEVESSLESELLAQSEEYLRTRGAKLLYGGGICPVNPFYLGLYGGSELPGILDSDRPRQEIFRAGGYREIDRVAVLHLELARFRAVINRQQLQLRRQMQVTVTYDPPSKSWWEACTSGSLERTRFDLTAQPGGPVLASVTFWNMEPLATSWGVRAMGLIDLEVDEEHRRQGLASYLIAEALRRLALEGISLVEAQTMAHNTAALALYKCLGFTEIDHGVVFRKQ